MGRAVRAIAEIVPMTTTQNDLERRNVLITKWRNHADFLVKPRQDEQLAEGSYPRIALERGAFHLRECARDLELDSALGVPTEAVAVKLDFAKMSHMMVHGIDWVPVHEVEIKLIELRASPKSREKDGGRE